MKLMGYMFELRLKVEYQLKIFGNFRIYLAGLFSMNIKWFGLQNIFMSIVEDRYLLFDVRIFYL